MQRTELAGFTMYSLFPNEICKIPKSTVKPEDDLASINFCIQKGCGVWLEYAHAQVIPAAADR